MEIVVNGGLTKQIVIYVLEQVQHYLIIYQFNQITIGNHVGIYHLIMVYSYMETQNTILVMIGL